MKKSVSTGLDGAGCFTFRPRDHVGTSCVGDYQNSTFIRTTAERINDTKTSVDTSGTSSYVISRSQT
ncbi:hypothetical protein RRG08_033137 [Elysia crispata]|uniref:Uncharacterized protein n=1 Tax=Elysia crispata TaxID=231223 RepID=A0AAE1A6J5_9GAST|nr:hypothetical protein RRG08_033137 [Elysia crispata]